MGMNMLMEKMEKKTFDEILQNIKDFKGDLIVLEEDTNYLRSLPFNKLLKFIIGLELLNKIGSDIGFELQKLGHKQKETISGIWESSREKLHELYENEDLI